MPSRGCSRAGSELEPAVIVVLTGFEDIFLQFHSSVEWLETDSDKVVVTSRGVKLPLDWSRWPRWTFVKGVEPFVFARNANLGIAAAGRRDVLLVNDDVQFTRRNTLSDLQRIAYSCPHIGVLSPQFIGCVGNPLQRCGGAGGALVYSSARLCFTCVYLKRSVLDKIGELDERFDGYGGEDDDYCWRVQDASYRLAVTSEVIVKHGFRSLTRATTSFDRTAAVDRAAVTERSTAKLREKWPGKVFRP